KTLNVIEFYYPEEVAAFECEFVEAQRAAYMETCVEDDEIALRMDAGRKALFERGDDEAGPYQSPMEDGMQHFHEWYRRVMGLGGTRGTPWVCSFSLARKRPLASERERAAYRAGKDPATAAPNRGKVLKGWG